MKRILYILFAALTLSLQVSCQKEDASADISGEWHLDNSGLAYDADVYVVFSGGSFRLYQKVGDQSRPWLYEGTYSVSDNVLTGRYSDGTRLGGASGQGYRVGIERGAATEDGGNDSVYLILTSVFSGTQNRYEKTPVPADIIDSAVPPVKSEDIPAPVL